MNDPIEKAKEIIEEFKHYGPGPHKGTGTPQSVHAGFKKLGGAGVLQAVSGMERTQAREYVARLRAANPKKPTESKEEIAFKKAYTTLNNTAGELSKSQNIGMALGKEAIGAFDSVPGSWVDLPVIGSQSTPRQVSVSFWEKGSLSRIYINERINSRTPRSGSMGYIDAKTGKINGNQFDIARAIGAIGHYMETNAGTILETRKKYGL